MDEETKTYCTISERGTLPITMIGLSNDELVQIIESNITPDQKREAEKHIGGIDRLRKPTHTRQRKGSVSQLASLVDGCYNYYIQVVDDDGHLKRVAKLTSQTMRELRAYGRRYNGVSDEITEGAALLHDLGKVVVPSEVLNGASQPRNEVKTNITWPHTLLGYMIGRGVRLPKEILYVILFHHYNDDPIFKNANFQRPTLNSIPPLVQIVTMADICDAGTTRSYIGPDGTRGKTAAPSEVLYDIASKRGLTFDSLIVDKFLQHAPKSQEVRHYKPILE